MPLIDLILQVVEATWALSVTVAPAIFLVFFILYLSRRGKAPSYLSVIISSQRDSVLAYSMLLVPALVMGGAVNAFTGGLLPGVIVATLVAGYGVSTRPFPDPEPLDLHRISEYVHLVWVVVPVLSVAALVFGNLLLKSVLAVVFYAVIFWEL